MQSPDTTATTIAIDGFDYLIEENAELLRAGEEMGLQASSTQTAVTSDDVTVKKSNKVSYACALNCALLHVGCGVSM